MPDHPFTEFKYGVQAAQGGDPPRLLAMFKRRHDADVFIRAMMTEYSEADGWRFQYVPI